MQSITTDSSDQLSTALSFLESKGFCNKKQNVRLLHRSNFNAEVVANFLEAKNYLKANFIVAPTESKKVKFNITKCNSARSKTTKIQNFPQLKERLFDLQKEPTANTSTFVSKIPN